MRPRDLWTFFTMLAVSTLIFTSGYAVGRASTAGRSVVEEISREDLQKVVDKLDEPSRAFVAATKGVAPAVAHVIVTRLVRYQDPWEGFFDDPAWERYWGRRRPRIGKEQSTGTGVIVDSRGYLLTNAHVVKDAADILVRLADGRELKGRALGISEQTDLAVVKIEGKDFPVAALGESDALQVGQWVIAIGNPFGLEQTVTAGIVSAMGRAGVGIAEYEDFIQTDAPINPGNSGGPLINLKGEVVGINTAIYSRSGGYQGIGFAVPIKLARLVMDRIVKKG